MIAEVKNVRRIGEPQALRFTPCPVDGFCSGGTFSHCPAAAPGAAVDEV